MVQIALTNKPDGVAPDPGGPYTEQEQKLIRILRKLDYGEVRIMIKDGAPVRIEEIKKSIKL
ncbi:MAG: DUF2292 domain-containing protein [Clostridiales bacterium]|nr:DUF2292 domain-containing protein [Clostridiales bacterium]